MIYWNEETGTELARETEVLRTPTLTTSETLDVTAQVWVALHNLKTTLKRSN